MKDLYKYNYDELTNSYKFFTKDKIEYVVSFTKDDTLNLILGKEAIIIKKADNSIEYNSCVLYSSILYHYKNTNINFIKSTFKQVEEILLEKQ